MQCIAKYMMSVLEVQCTLKNVLSIIIALQFSVESKYVVL